MSTLEERVRTLEDREALRELVARYANAIDDRDLDAVVACFTRDATIGRADGTVGGSGSDGVRAFYEKQMRNMHMTFHSPHTQVLDFTGPDSANGVVTSSAEMAVDGALVVSSFRYVDEYAREDDAWRIRNRRMHFFYIMDVTELPGHVLDAERNRWPGPPRAAELPESLATYQAFRAGID